MCYETIWPIYLTEPQRVSKEILTILVGRCGDLLVLQSPRKASLLITTAPSQSGVLCLSLWSLLALCEEFWISPRELLRSQTKVDQQKHSKDLVWTSLESPGCHLETHIYKLEETMEVQKGLYFADENKALAR